MTRFLFLSTLLATSVVHPPAALRNVPTGTTFAGGNTRRETNVFVIRVCPQVYDSTKRSPDAEESKSFRLAISTSMDCSGLRPKLVSPPRWSSKAPNQRWNDGVTVLLLPRETGGRRALARRDVEAAAAADGARTKQDHGCRSVPFPPQ